MKIKIKLRDAKKFRNNIKTCQVVLDTEILILYTNYYLGYNKKSISLYCNNSYPHYYTDPKTQRKRKTWGTFTHHQVASVSVNRDHNYLEGTKLLTTFILCPFIQYIYSDNKVNVRLSEEFTKNIKTKLSLRKRWKSNLTNGIFFISNRIDINGYNADKFVIERRNMIDSMKIEYNKEYLELPKSYSNLVTVQETMETIWDSSMIY